jgi:FtsH-binding integral membrane protein
VLTKVGSVARGAERKHAAMAETIALIVYILFCILVGVCGSQRRMGFTGTFILSFFVTPLVVLIVLLLTGPSQRVEKQRQSQGK